MSEFDHGEIRWSEATGFDKAYDHTWQRTEYSKRCTACGIWYSEYGSILRRIDAMQARGHRPLILDLGANVGAASLWFANSFPTARVVAVEPDRDNAAVCRANAVGRDIVVVEAAVGAQPGRVTLVNQSYGEWAVMTERSNGDGGVPVVTVSDLIAEHGEDCELLLVKVDIEGFEDDLFSENTEWVDQAAVVFVEPHDWMFPDRRSSRSFQRLFGSKDFDLVLSGENLVYIRI